MEFNLGTKGWLNIWIAANVIHHINRGWDKTSLLSHQRRKNKTLDKIQHSLVLKILNNLGIAGNFLSLRRSIYESSPTEASLAGRGQTFPPWDLGHVPLSVLLTVVDVLSRGKSGWKRSRRRGMLYLQRMAWSPILTIKGIHENPPETMNELSSVTRHQVRAPKSSALLCILPGHSTEETRKMIPFTIASNNAKKSTGTENYKTQRQKWKKDLQMGRHFAFMH